MRFMHTALITKPHPSRTHRRPHRAARRLPGGGLPHALATLVAKSLGGGSH